MTAKVLLFGYTGKVGTALTTALSDDYTLIGVNSKDIDVRDLEAVDRLLKKHQPDIVINTVAMLGLDACEAEPSRATAINTLFPQRLAHHSADIGYRLIHFSTESIFSGKETGFFAEDDDAYPLNQYGFTKYASELAVRLHAPDSLIFRLPVLFGPSPKRNQLLEKMIDRVRDGANELRIANDIVTTPTYSVDIAETVVKALKEGLAPGLYHIANSEKATLHQLVSEAVSLLGLHATVHQASHTDFPSPVDKALYTPLIQSKLPPLRPWREALAAYCRDFGC